jgi:hypothetical protein
MTQHYTNSKGESVEIATMAYPHLVSAHKKAVANGASIETLEKLMGTSRTVGGLVGGVVGSVGPEGGSIGTSVSRSGA